MENNTSDYVYKNVIQIDDADASRKYLANVFIWMFAALGISAVITFEITQHLDFLKLIVDPVNGGFTGLGYIAIFSPLAFSVVINFGYNKISYPIMVFLFLAYAAVIGISLSILCLIYTASSIFSVFLTTSLVFGVMAVAGYTTRQDLTKFGSILYMIFIGAFIAGLVNFFLGSAQISYILSFVFAAAMIGLTSYYVQLLKRIGAGLEYGSAQYKKLVIIGAFTLYTTFINLFISLLRIFGNRR
ncbi:Bax inhibitor-1/YccA family protein [Mucilaginibacter segetis]|uniref:Bax inhibitor-1/YccA family protein n=1 Tax=Mucilaginibacter segetis TaxID=2793071 RepID=A0A934PXG8_9SPHI|nr:Bax inhibitor-1/YccA family protein [Mucilaginibacter segetis]MBK0381241.1 Bax inhibitor-1/YccA family protein [Mucilaginibacter segetis]